MLSIYQIKEGINILNDIDAKSYRTEMKHYIWQHIKTEYGLDIYDGYGNLVTFIPVMMPASAVRISPSVTDIHANDTESTAINETSGVFAVSDNNLAIFFKSQLAEFNTIKAKMTNAKSALWYFNTGPSYNSISVTIPATVSSGSFKLYRYNGSSWTNMNTVSVSSSKVTLTVTDTGYYYVGS